MYVMFNVQQVKRNITIGIYACKNSLDCKIYYQIRKKASLVLKLLYSYFISFFSKNSKNGCASCCKASILKRHSKYLTEKWFNIFALWLLCEFPCKDGFTWMFCLFLVINVYLLIFLFASWLCMFLRSSSLLCFIILFPCNHGGHCKMMLNIVSFICVLFVKNLVFIHLPLYFTFIKIN